MIDCAPVKDKGPTILKFFPPALLALTLGGWTLKSTRDSYVKCSLPNP